MRWTLRVLQSLLPMLLAAALWLPAPTAQAQGTEQMHTVHYASMSPLLEQSAAPSRGQRLKGWLRGQVLSDEKLTRYGLVLDGDAAAERPVVFFVHGFNSNPEGIAPIIRSVQQAGHVCGAFAYPNDQPLGPSAVLLSAELKRFVRRYPQQRIVLVCHSMGGMVARACLEDPELDPGNVDRLIMIAPPNQGSLVAHFAVGTDLWEHWLGRRDGGLWRRFEDSVIDGLGEAADDLVPGSDFLETVNGRPRHADVQYSILLGSSAAMTEEEMLWTRSCIRESFGRLPGVDEQVGRIDDMLAQMDELVDGKGDGIVAIERGRLTGVQDTLVLPFGHLTITNKPDDPYSIALQQAVLERLE